MGERPLTDADYDRLADALNRFHGERRMNLEQLDGFFAALICGPDLVRPSEYLPEIWGGSEMADEEAFASQQQLKDFLDLVMRHWNAIAETLQSGDVHLPLLLEDEHGITHANDWAQGFLRGMALRRADWGELLKDEDEGGWIIPIFALAHEHDPDPAMRPYQEPMSAERREDLIVRAAAGITAIYRYFEPHRRMLADRGEQATSSLRRTKRTGRNDPCSLRVRQEVQALPVANPRCTDKAKSETSGPAFSGHSIAELVGSIAVGSGMVVEAILVPRGVPCRATGKIPFARSTCG
jgi:uncharacterized protein